MGVPNLCREWGPTGCGRPCNAQKSRSGEGEGWYLAEVSVIQDTVASTGWLYTVLTVTRPLYLFSVDHECSAGEKATVSSRCRVYVPSSVARDEEHSLPGVPGACIGQGRVGDGTNLAARCGAPCVVALHSTPPAGSGAVHACGGSGD